MRRTTARPGRWSFRKDGAANLIDRHPTLFIAVAVSCDVNHHVSPRVPAAIEYSTGPRGCHRPVLERNFTVDDDDRHALRVLVWLLECRGVMNGGRVEDDNVGLHALSKDAAIHEADALCRI